MPFGSFIQGNLPPNPWGMNFLGQSNGLNMGNPMPPSNFLMNGMGTGGPGAVFGGGYPRPGIGGRGFFQQGYPQQGHLQQGVPQQGYPPQGLFAQGLPPQTYQPYPAQFSSQPYQPPYQGQPQVFQPESPQKSGGIKGLISRFMAGRKG